MTPHKLFLFVLGGTLFFSGCGTTFQIPNPTLTTKQTNTSVPTTTTQIATSTVLTEADFGHRIFDDHTIINAMSDGPNGTYHIEVNDTVPVYTIRVESMTTSTDPELIVLRGDDTTKPTQVLTIPRNSWQADSLANTFDVHDINFDGYADIGVAEDGGAKWASYQYWVFDPKSGMFISSTLTEEFRKLIFNEIVFDKKQHHIITNNFYGTLLAEKNIYVVQDNHLILLEKYYQDQGYKDDLPIRQCIITHTQYAKKEKKISTQILHENCTGYLGLK